MKFAIRNENSFIECEHVKFYEDSQDFEFIVNLKSGNFIIENKTVWAHKNELLNFYC